MSVSSLSRISVPLPGAPQGQTLLMPKLKYRFRVVASGFGSGNPSELVDLTRFVVSVNRPSVSFEDIQIDVYNSRSYILGKHTWETTTLELRDDVSGKIQNLVGDQVQKQFDFLNQSSASAGVDYKFRMNIEILDGGNAQNQPNVLETWSLLGASVMSVNWNDLNYATSEPVTISLTIRFDNAILNGDDLTNIPNPVEKVITGVDGSNPGSTS